MLKQGRLRALLELFRSLIHIEELLIDELVKLVEVEDELSGAEEGVPKGEVVGDGRPNRVVVLGEDCLEN